MSCTNTSVLRNGSRSFDIKGDFVRTSAPICVICAPSDLVRAHVARCGISIFTLASMWEKFGEVEDDAIKERSSPPFYCNSVLPFGVGKHNSRGFRVSYLISCTQLLIDQ